MCVCGVPAVADGGPGGAGERRGGEETPRLPPRRPTHADARPADAERLSPGGATGQGTRRRPQRRLRDGRVHGTTGTDGTTCSVLVRDRENLVCA